MGGFRTGFSVAYTTVEKKADAVKISETLIKEKLAACVNILPGLTSLYRWKGKTVQAREYLLVIKTRKKLLPLLGRRIKALSPYDVPEFISTNIIYGNKDYLEWLYKSAKT
jgi:periplasmic divalent cation tolerance protein